MAREKVADLHAAEWVRRVLGSPVRAMSTHLQMLDCLRISRTGELIDAVILRGYTRHGSSNLMIGIGNSRYLGILTTREWDLPRSSLASYGARLIRVNVDAVRGWESFLSHHARKLIMTIDLFRVPLKFSEMARREK
jgi:hypothetical protein